MSVKIITKHETGGTGDEPLSTDLEKGELGVNTVDGKLWVGDGASKKLLTGGGGLIDGLADGNTLRWEDSTSEWEATSNLVVADTGSVTAKGDITATTSFRYGTNLHLVNTSTGGTSWSINSSGQDSVLGAGNLELSVTSQGPKAVLKANGDFTASKFIGDGSLLTNVPGFTQWDDVTGGINYAGESVGIGTDNPTKGLSVYKGTGIVTAKSQDGFDNGYYIGMRSAYSAEMGTVYCGGGTEAERKKIVFDAYGNETAFYAGPGNNNTEAMRITSSGNIGIGTGSPVNVNNYNSLSLAGPTAGSLDFTDVDGTPRATIFAQGGSLWLRNRGTAAMIFEMGAANTEAMRIDASGNVKINTGNLELSGGGGWYQDSNTVWLRVLGTKQIYNSNATAAAFATPGDFSAGYSDMRLKTHLGTIPDALDKVCSLEGFYYERNDVAQSLGYQGGERRVGLSAQDVQAVLPEVVKDAPINIDNGTDYLTVDYERVVPLLVEAIKAQQIQIDELKRNQK